MFLTQISQYLKPFKLVPEFFMYVERFIKNNYQKYRYENLSYICTYIAHCKIKFVY